MPTRLVNGLQLALCNAKYFLNETECISNEPAKEALWTAWQGRLISCLVVTITT